MSFLEIDSWKVLSIWLMAYISAFRSVSWSEAELPFELPQAESAKARIAHTPPINSVRIGLSAPSGAAGDERPMMFTRPRESV
jgi:hypothetical protein